MLTWHLFTNDQTVLLQTQCLISEPVDKFSQVAFIMHNYRMLHEFCLQNSISA